MVGCWGAWWSVGLNGGVLGYMVGSVKLHGGECWVIWWGVGSYMVGSVELHGGSVKLHSGEC